MPTLNITYTVDIDFTPLDTWAKVDEVVADVTYDNDEAGFQVAAGQRTDRRAARSQSQGAKALAKKNADLLSAQNQAAVPGLTAQEKQDADEKVEALVSQRKTILRNNRVNNGPEAVLADIDAAPAAGERAFYVALLAALATHRATLTA